MDKHVISKLKSFSNELSKLKGDLEREDYKWVQELKQLQLEEREINRRMEENKRKAMNEKDPAQKALLLQLIEDDGKKLKANMRKQQELSNKFNFDPNKRIDDLIKSIKEAIENNRGGNSRGGGGTSNRNRNNNEDDEDDNNDDYTNNSGNGSGLGSRRKEDKNQTQPSQQQLIIFGGIALLIIFYLYSQKQEKEPNYYDF